MTLHGAWYSGNQWLKHAKDHHNYRSVTFPGADRVPLHGWLSHHDSNDRPTRGTIIATYGITGDLNNQWYLRLFAQHAQNRGYAVLLIDWRGHGNSAQYSPTLTSDGIHEGRDFLHAAHWLKRHNYPAPFFFMGYSLGGQLALWAAKYASEHDPSKPLVSRSEHRNVRYSSLRQHSSHQDPLVLDDIGGVTTLAPTLHSPRSLRYLATHDVGRQVDRCITRSIHALVRNLHRYHPNEIDLRKLERVQTMRDYDQEYVIPTLGFSSVDDYLEATVPLHFLADLNLPTQIIYAANDPMFDPTLSDDVRHACANNPAIDLIMTEHGGHIAHRSDLDCQQRYGDPDPWWAMHRSLDWIDQRAAAHQTIDRKVRDTIAA
jgi:predicted alpha/beta-fold hydrolase